MSLFKFGFSKRDTSSGTKLESDNAASSAASADVSQSPGISGPPLSVVRDPALPTDSVFLDSEVKLGPIVMDIKNTHAGRGFRMEWTANRK